MAIQLVNRYKQLLVSVPKGAFYASDGQVLPHRDIPYGLRISTGVATREYGIFVNEVYKGNTVTDIDGVATVSVLLDKGRNDIKLVDSFNQTETMAYVTTREYATWMAAEAEVIESIDTGIEQVMLDARLDTASISLIEEVFGKTVKTGNSFGYDLDTYRELLQELRIAYRYWGGTADGIARVTRAFTQISPLIYPRSFGPEWILGSDMLRPEVDPGARTLFTISPLTNINSGGQWIDILGFGPDNGLGSAAGPSPAALTLYNAAVPDPGLTWTAPNGSEGPLTTIVQNGEHTLSGGWYFNQIIGVPGPYNISAGNNDSLALEVDKLGVIVVTLTAGAAVTAATIASDINTALNADPRYGASYNAVASAYDVHVSGSPMISLTTPNGSISNVDTVGVKIHTNGLVDAAQTLFDIPVVRGGLSTGYSAGAASIVLSAATDMTAWPLATVDEPINVIIGRTTFHPVGAPNAAAAPTDTEMVLINNVDRGTKTLTIQGALGYNHNANELVYLEGETPYNRPNVIDSRTVTIRVNDFASLPIADTSDVFTIGGTGLPDGWIAELVGGGAPTLTEQSLFTYFDMARDVPFDLTPNHQVSIPVPDDILDYRGFNVTISVWGRIDDPSRPATQTDMSQIGVSFDNQATYDSAAPTVSGVAVNSQFRPKQYSRTLNIPVTATKVWVRASVTNATGDFTIHKVRVTVQAHGGLYLGDGTTPRSESRIKSSAFLYVWWPDDPLPYETDSLGITNIDQSVPGHIDTIAPDMAWLDKFIIVDPGSGTNQPAVHGAFDETSFSVGSMVNLDTVLRTPSRFSWMKPTTINDIVQIVVFDVTGPYPAPITIEADQDQTKAFLLEDGVPVLREDWQFNSSTEIELLYAPDVNAVYEFHYNALLQFETAVIDLDTTFADYLWFADYHVLLRPEIRPTEVQITSGVQFDAAATATLPERAIQDQTSATLTEDTGFVRRTVPTTVWSFVDAQTIRISLGSFNANSIYEITYTAEVNHPDTDAVATVELRSAATSGAVVGASYGPVVQNQPVDSSLRYHQMRVTLNGIRSLEDARITSVLLKGLGLFGSGPIPILKP